MVYLRTWKKLNLEEVKEHLLVVGELSAECFNCREIGINFERRGCPKCGNIFKYIAFRREVRPQDFKRFKEDRPRIELIDFSDFKKALNKKEARNIFNET